MAIIVIGAVDLVQDLFHSLLSSTPEVRLIITDDLLNPLYISPETRYSYGVLS